MTNYRATGNRSDNKLPRISRGHEKVRSLGHPRTVHPFPARMASEVALNALIGLPAGSSVLDPMCGSGVVVRRALDQGHQAMGVDIDPLAVLMSRVWTARISSSIEPSFGLKLAEKAKSFLGTEIELPWIDQDQSTSHYIKYWFAPTQQEHLRALLAVSNALRGQRRDLFSLALSRTIVTKSKGASLAADTSHSRPHRVRSDNDFDVLSGFVQSFDRLIRILRTSPVNTSGKVKLGDARSLRGVKRESIDAVVTSPPYMNAIDYLRGHKLSLVWLGYSISSIRDIKAFGVGARTQQKPDLRSTDRLDAIVRAASSVKLPSDSERLAKRYVYDMLACLQQTYRVLHPAGYAVYVISNSTLQGVELDTATIMVELASQVGFQLADSYVREIPRKHRYLPPPDTTSNPQLSTRMRTESVLRFQKNRHQETSTRPLMA